MDVNSIYIEIVHVHAQAATNVAIQCVMQVYIHR